MQTHGGEIGATQLQKALWEDEEAIRSYSLGPRQVAFLIISVATVIAGIILATDPDLYLAAIIILSIFGVTLTLYRLDWGLIYFLGCTLLFDQYPVPDFDPFTYRISYFENLKVN